MGCSGAFHLAEVLKKNPTLDIVDLSFNRLEDEGAVYLGKVLSSRGCGLRAWVPHTSTVDIIRRPFPFFFFHSFEHSSIRLSVSWNNIRTEGLLALAQAVKFNPNLTHINIWGNYLEEPVCQVRCGFHASCLCLSVWLHLYLLLFRPSKSWSSAGAYCGTRQMLQHMRWTIRCVWLKSATLWKNSIRGSTSLPMIMLPRIFLFVFLRSYFSYYHH